MRKCILRIVSVFIFLGISFFGVINSNNVYAAAYNASDVLGQSLGGVSIFTKGLSNNTNATDGFSSPSSIALDTVNHRLFVADISNNRVLVFNLDNSNNLIDRTADFVLGQADFTSSVSATTRNGMSYPQGLTFDSTGNRLFVTDSYNHRVLIFNTTSITNGMDASNVIGQADFTSAVSTTTQNGMNYPRDVYFDNSNNRLFVTDNSRVLIFDTTSIIDGMNASNVLGQADFTSSVSTTTQNGMNYPRGFTFDSAGNRLFVADASNNRVLVFDTTSITDGMNASNVIGQADFTSFGSATTRNGMSYPQGLTFDSTGNRLFVTDSLNFRVLVFNTTSISNGMNASNVLGQADFTSSVSTTTQNGMYSPQGLTLDSTGNRLFVADSSNNRVLVFDTTSIIDGMNASNVLGQTDYLGNPVYTSSNINNNSTNPLGFNNPIRFALDTAYHRLFVTDSYNNRVLVFNLDNSNNLIDRTADFVLGQADFTSSASATTQNGMYNSQGLTFDSTGNRLFVADSGNSRVLVFDTTSIVDGMNASSVIGQADFTSSASATTQNGMSNPRDLTFDSTGNRLFVADSGNSRVLIFDTTSITDGINASNVLGQADFTSSASATTQNGVYNSQGLTFDSTGNRLFVTDSYNHRVLVFDTTSIVDGMNASNVIGQADFTSAVSVTTQNGMNSPRGGIFDAVNNRLYVADHNNHRVLVFDTTSITDGMNASSVIGQADFTSSVSATTQNGMYSPRGGVFDAVNNRLYVADYTNHRVIIFDFVKPSATFVSGQVGSPYTGTISNTNSQGLVTYSISSGSLPTGLALSGSTISGTPTTAGIFNFDIEATDSEDWIFKGKISTSITINAASEVTPSSSGSRSRTNTTIITPSNIVTVSTACPIGHLFSITNGLPCKTFFIPSTSSGQTPICAITQTLRQGSKGDQVKCLQTGLKILSDGIFGPTTKASVVNFQQFHNLVPDGIFGPKSLEKWGR